MTLDCDPVFGSCIGQLAAFPAIVSPEGSSEIDIRLPGVPSWPGSAPEIAVMTLAWWLVPWPWVLGIRLRSGE